MNLQHTVIHNISFSPSGSGSAKGDASDEDDENEFFDAMEDPAGFITVPADPKYHRSARLYLFLFTLCFSLSFFPSLKPLFINTNGMAFYEQYTELLEGKL